MPHRTDIPHEPGTLDSCWECNPPSQQADSHSARETESLKPGSYIERGPGQLCSVLKAERKKGQDGYRILPLSNGLDGYGYSEWVDRAYAEARVTTEDQWEYNLEHNCYNKRYNKSEDGDL